MYASVSFTASIYVKLARFDRMLPHGNPEIIEPFTRSLDLLLCTTIVTHLFLSNMLEVCIDSFESAENAVHGGKYVKKICFGRVLFNLVCFILLN